jgi:starvation-inducible outer membrane lipoprotein
MRNETLSKRQPGEIDETPHNLYQFDNQTYHTWFCTFFSLQKIILSHLEKSPQNTIR